MSLQGDILRIQNIVGRRYKAEGKACVAGISDGVKASSCFTGDAEVMLDILADMAGNTIGQMSEDPEELTRISMAFRRAVTRSAHDYYAREHPGEALPATTLADVSAEERKVLLN